MADERCTPHGPTLAEMVERLRARSVVWRGELSATDAAELERFAEEVAAVEAARAVLAFFEGLFRLHAPATFRAGMARTGRPICDSFEMGAGHQVEGHETCARCLWSRRSHHP